MGPASENLHNTGSRTASFDHFIGAGQERRGISRPNFLFRSAASISEHSLSPSSK
jgi:hypothetical protein